MYSKIHDNNFSPCFITTSNDLKWSLLNFYFSFVFRLILIILSKILFSIFLIVIFFSIYLFNFASFSLHLLFFIFSLSIYCFFFFLYFMCVLRLVSCLIGKNKNLFENLPSQLDTLKNCLLELPLVYDILKVTPSYNNKTLVVDQSNTHRLLQLFLKLHILDILM